MSRSTRSRAAESEGRAGQLTADAIVEAALQYVRKYGVDSMTMRALAGELGVTVAAAYHYIPGRANLIERVADAVLDLVEPPDAASGDWVEELRRHSTQCRCVLLDHPGVAALFVRETQSPTMLRHINAVLAVLRAAGFDALESLEAFSTLTTFVVGGAILSERHLKAGGRDDVGERLRGAAEGMDLGVLASMRGDWPPAGDASYFTYGLELILVGLQSRVPTRRTGAAQPSVSSRRAAGAAQC